MKRLRMFLLSTCILYVLGALLSCESTTGEDPVPPGNNNPPDNSVDDPDPATSDIEGCQYMWNDTTLLNLNNSMMLETGSFKVLNGGQVYVVFGFSFSVDFSGSVKEMGIKVPEVGTYTVRIYNADILSDEILAETEITADNDDWKYVAIDPLALDPDQTYIACVYIPSKPDQQESFFYHIPEFNYPLELGDLTIEGYAWSQENNEKVKPEPKDPAFNILNGLVDLCFEAE